MEKFTKGPWSPHGGLIYAPTKGDDVVVAATGSNNPVSEANAHLIAAAPEMYNFIKKCSLAFASDYPSLRDSANELLAKARGEQ